MIRGQAKFDGLTVAKVTVSFIGPTLDFSAEAAFVSSQTGQTHGWTKNNQWSPETIGKLKELRELMETDLGRIHLEGGGELSQAATGPRFAAQPLGLAEHLGTDKVPSV